MDKQIRLGVDITPLGRLRQEVANLTSDLVRMNREASKYPSPTDYVRKPLSSNLQPSNRTPSVRNDGTFDFPSTTQTPRSSRWRAEREAEIERNHTIDQSNDPFPQSVTDREAVDSWLQRNAERTARRKREIEELTNPVDLEPEFRHINRRPTRPLPIPEIQREELLEESQEESSPVRTTRRRKKKENFSDESINSLGDVMGSLREPMNKLAESFKDSGLSDPLNKLVELAIARNGSLDSLVNILNRTSNNEGSANIVPVPNTIPEDNSENPNRVEDNRREKDKSSGNNIFRSGTGVTSSLVNGAVSAWGNTMNSRNAFESGAQIAGAVGQTVGSVTASVGNAFGPIGGAIGGVVGGAIAGIGSIVSTYAMRAVAKAEELERNTLSYVQTSGESMSRSKSRAFSEGSYAAGALGLNAGEYMQKRGEMLRASGGKILGSDQSDPRGVRESNSILSVQRLMGIQQSSINQLQATMRFANPNGTRNYEDPSNSPSSVIRIFENAMERLKLPFSEIASTMEESLSTFNRTAEHILDRAGEFDAGKVSSILANIRYSTGMQGKQLERVQESVTGQAVSQDPVTQAILMRVARQVHPEVTTFPEIMALIEKMPQDKNMQAGFLDAIQGFSRQDPSQIANLLKAAFPKMSWGDTVDITKDFAKGDRDLKDIVQDYGVQFGESGDTIKAQYSSTAATKTVGSIEAATKTKDNLDAANGESMLRLLSGIDSEVRKMVTNTSLTERYLNAVKDGIAALVLLADKDSRKKTITYKGVKYGNNELMTPLSRLIDKLFE